MYSMWLFALRMGYVGREDPSILFVVLHGNQPDHPELSTYPQSSAKLFMMWRDTFEKKAEE